ncbi:MAG: dTDP-4-dehydrorhamnose 3,5-epimerase [Flavobacterium sp.]|nr:dTDP-4-dehydrorhamnose 3,5-epimerase [Flavobacterium sp.]
MGIEMINLKTKIHDLELISLKQIKDDRGAVYHFLKSTDSTFKGFGEAYYSKINPEVIKGWKLHHRLCQNFCVPIGAVKIVVYDDRDESPTKGELDEIILNDSNNYCLLSMPAGLWYSFKCISEDFALLANIIDQLHDPLESITLPLENNIIQYEWK